MTKKVKLSVKSDVKPVFCKARSVPLRFKSLVRDELKRLEECKVITKVLSSEWASPTVVVMKSNNTIRLCGDYSSTINKFMDVARYPLPTIEEISAKMNNVKFFSKLDLQSAFLQIPLDEESKKLTINLQNSS